MSAARVSTGAADSSTRQQRPSANGSDGAKYEIDGYGVHVFRADNATFTDVPPTQFDNTRFRVSLTQHMGDRRTQEDRYTICPRLDPTSSNAQHFAFFGVFDGTVGDFASDNVKDLVMPKLTESRSWQRFRRGTDQADEECLIVNAVKEMYAATDHSLLQLCSRSQQHYATCTSVTMFLLKDYLVTAHLGDSRICLGIIQNNKIVGEFATTDHKPDLDHERRRIEECGGMVERLVNHNNKPFIRGGDFMMRKALGEQPMQLQYSRAFGGKDLKIFGLSSEPDVNIMRMNGRVKWAILASDGLWDVISEQQAVMLCEDAQAQNESPSQFLVRKALVDQAKRQARADNITCVVVQLV